MFYLIVIQKKLIKLNNSKKSDFFIFESNSFRTIVVQENSYARLSIDRWDHCASNERNLFSFIL